MSKSSSFTVRILSFFAALVFVVNAGAFIVWADPEGSAKANCWDSGGQLEVKLKGCSGYKSITVTAEFSGKITSAAGWGFDEYKVNGNRVDATVSSSGANSWAFDSTVGIQVTGSGINSAKLISVKGSGTDNSKGKPTEQTRPSETSATASSSSADTSSNETSSSSASPSAAKSKGKKGDDWLTTSGSEIVDKDGRIVWLTGCNWFGYNTGTNLFDGVWNCNLKDSLKSIADHGFNLLRVPMSSELLLQWKDGEYPKANYNNAYNEELNSMNSLEIFDYVLELCEDNGMKVMIDIHTAKTDASGHNHPVWYREDITEKRFIESLSWIAERYKDNDTVVAYDLKNEPHGKASETPHAVWNDSGDPNNWRMVAQKAGNAILDKNPNALIVVEGIQIYPLDIKKNNFESTNDEDYYNTWWGANLMGVRDYPIDFGSPERNKQVVYSPHDYGPKVFMQPWFEGGFTYESLMKDAWSPYWLFIRDENIAPILIGEWGGFMEGDNLKWMEYIRQLIKERRLSHTFWCFNANSGDTGGLVLDDFKTWDEDKYKLVREDLWQDDDGKFVGLDHEIALGANGISLSDFDGKLEPIKVAGTMETTETRPDATKESMQDSDTKPDEAVVTSSPGKNDKKDNGESLIGAFRTFEVCLAVTAGVLVCIIIFVTVRLVRSGKNSGNDKNHR